MSAIDMSPYASTGKPVHVEHELGTFRVQPLPFWLGVVPGTLEITVSDDDGFLVEGYRLFGIEITLNPVDQTCTGLLEIRCTHEYLTPIKPLLKEDGGLPWSPSPDVARKVVSICREVALSSGLWSDESCEQLKKWHAASRVSSLEIKVREMKDAHAKAVQDLVDAVRDLDAL